MEYHYPIMIKLRDLRDQTYRQTYNKLLNRLHITKKPLTNRKLSTNSISILLCPKQALIRLLIHPWQNSYTQSCPLLFYYVRGAWHYLKPLVIYNILCLDVIYFGLYIGLLPKDVSTLVVPDIGDTK